jgi:hypothetical protein
MKAMNVKLGQCLLKMLWICHKKRKLVSQNCCPLSICKLWQWCSMPVKNSHLSHLRREDQTKISFPLEMGQQCDDETCLRWTSLQSLLDNKWLLSPYCIKACGKPAHLIFSCLEISMQNGNRTEQVHQPMHSPTRQLESNIYEANTLFCPARL